MNAFLALAINDVVTLGAGCNQAGCAGDHPGGSYPGGGSAKNFGKRKPGSTRTKAAHSKYVKTGETPQAKHNAAYAKETHSARMKGKLAFLNNK